MARSFGSGPFLLGYEMPTGPDCNMDWDECLAWARQQDGIDDPEAYCGSKEAD